MPAGLIARCIGASAACGAACDQALAHDAAYTSPGTDPYSESHLALLSCASVCALVARALGEGDADLELLRWCAEVCCATAAHVSAAAPDPMYMAVVESCLRCADACRCVMDDVARQAQNAIGATRDTGFQDLIGAR